MARKFTTLTNKDYKVKFATEERKRLKEEGQEDIILYNPTYKRRLEYFKHVEELNKKFEYVEEELKYLLVLIAGIKAFTDLEMDCDTFEAYTQVLVKAHEQSKVFRELREELTHILTEVNEITHKTIEMQDYLENNKEEIKLENMSKEELIEYAKQIKNEVK